MSGIDRSVLGAFFADPSVEWDAEEQVWLVGRGLWRLGLIEDGWYAQQQMWPGSYYDVTPAARGRETVEELLVEILEDPVVADEGDEQYVHLLVHAARMGGWLSADYVGQVYGQLLSDAGFMDYVDDGGPVRYVLTGPGYAAAADQRGTG